MSTKRTYVIEVKNKIEISTMSQADINHVEKQLIQMFADKLEKLKSQLTVCKHAWVDGCLYIHDERGIVSELPELLDAYGLTYSDISTDIKTTIKGKMYQVTDALIELHHFINGSHHDIGATISRFQINGQELAQQIQSIMSKGDIQSLKTNLIHSLTANTYLKDIIQSAQKGKTLHIEETQQKRMTENDGRIISEQIINTTSLEKHYQKAQFHFQDEMRKINEMHQSHMIEGTTQSLAIRAKKMGYVVQKKSVGEDVQLVLVRRR